MRQDEAMKNLLVLATLLLFISCRGPGLFGVGGEPAATPHWNVNSKGLAIRGYDPVAYFPEAGGTPLRGDPRRSLELDGATYRFANEENRDRFAATPERFTPLYGGWCAWAMADAQKVEVNPKAFVISDAGLELFYRSLLADTRRQWLDGDTEALRSRANEAWIEFSASQVPAE